MWVRRMISPHLIGVAVPSSQAGVPELEFFRNSGSLGPLIHHIKFVEVGSPPTTVTICCPLPLPRFSDSLFNKNDSLFLEAEEDSTCVNFTTDPQVTASSGAS